MPIVNLWTAGRSLQADQPVGLRVDVACGLGLTLVCEAAGTSGTVLFRQILNPVSRNRLAAALAR